MPGNQDDETIKVGYMIKKSQGKSAIGATNFKKRVFVLTRTRLSYYDGTPEKRGNLKGFVDLSKVTVVEKVVDTAFDKPSLQITHDDLTLYIVARSVEEQEEWIDFIRHYCNSSMLQGKYHPGVFTSGKWTCCEHKSKHSQGCADTSIRTQSSALTLPMQAPSRGHTRSITLPVVSSPDAAAISHTSSRDLVNPHSILLKRGGGSVPTIVRPPVAPPDTSFEVVACFDYKGEINDLTFKKGQILTVFDDSQQHWWKARDANGNEGSIPSNYVKKKQGLENEEWYFPDMSRISAETALKEDGKEGCFVIRNSSREKSYTLSLLRDNLVRHYHIKQDEAKRYFISEKHAFSSIRELVDYHKLNSAGLSTRLRKPPFSMAKSEPAPVFDEAWEIDKRDLELGRELGSGQFGRVVAGKWKSVDVAIKMMKEGAMNEDDFIAEAKVMKQFKHDNLVRLFGVCTKDGPMFIVTEYMVNGSLLQYIRYKRDILKMTDTLVDMAVQICSAMAYLEVNGFIHRDLLDYTQAARNCLVGERNVVKVADFGLARFVTDDEYTASEGTKFPIKWAPPEVITYAKFSSKSDVWSFGILLWELWTAGKTPYPTFSNSQVLDQVLIGYRLDQPPGCPQQIYDVMFSSWQASPEARPSFKELLASLKQLLDYSDATE